MMMTVTARHSSSGRQPNFVAWHKEWNYQTFTEGTTYIRQGGHHVAHILVFYLFIGLWSPFLFQCPWCHKVSEYIDSHKTQRGLHFLTKDSFGCRSGKQ